MSASHILLELNKTLYSLRGKNLTAVAGLRELRGDKIVVSDFEGAVAELRTVESTSKFAPAVLEKDLREMGHIEIGGRVVVLHSRKRGDRATEILYLASSVPIGLERDMDREETTEQTLLFPLHKLLSTTLESLSPSTPMAVMMLNQQDLDVVVGDKRNVYASFRISAFHSNADPERLSRNLDDALSEVERENNISIKKAHVMHVLMMDAKADRWISAVAASRKISCKLQKTTKIKINGNTAYSSVLSNLQNLKPKDSCSSPAVIAEYQMNQYLPVAAAGMAACCMLAIGAFLFFQLQATLLRSQVETLQADLQSRVNQVPTNVVDVSGALETAEQLFYARNMPSLRNVIAEVSSAAKSRSTQIQSVEVEYQPERVSIVLKGDTDKSRQGDSMLHYSHFISALRAAGYNLSDSDLNTDPNTIRFEMQLDQPLGEVKS